MKHRSLRLALLSAMLFVAFAAGAQTTVYLNEDFQRTTGSALPAGWDCADYQVNTSDPATYIWKSYTGGYYPAGTSSSGQRCAYLYAHGSYTAFAVLKTPEIAIPQYANAILRFKMKNTGSGGQLGVYVSTDGGVTYMQNQIAADLYAGTVWTDYEVPIMGYSGQRIRVAFRGVNSGVSSTHYYYYLDNVTIESAPTCRQPDNLYAQGLSSTGFNFSWGLKGAGYGSLPDTFHIRLLDPADSVVAEMRQPALQSTCAFTGLQPGTVYRAQVQSDCNNSYDGMSDWAELTVTTTTAPRPLPYVEDFNALTALPDGSVAHNVTLNTNASFSYGATGKSLKFATTATDNAYILLPMLDTRGDSIEVDFKLRRTLTTHLIHYMAGYITDPADMSTFVPAIADSLTVGTAWTDVTFNTAAVGGPERPVMLAVVVTEGAITNMYLDNVDVHALPSCLRPAGFRITHYTDTDVSLAWSAASPVLITVTGTTDTATYVATGSTYTVAGLTPNSDYRFTARCLCASGDTTVSAAALKCHTLCTVADGALLHEDFDGLATNKAPTCWQMGWINHGQSTEAYPFTVATLYKHGSSGKSMTLAKQATGTVSYLSTQRLHFDTAGRYDVSLWVYRQSTPAWYREAIDVWVTPEPNDTVGGVKLACINRHYASEPVEKEGAQWYQYQYNVPVAGDLFVMVVGKSTNGAAIYFDDLAVIEAPTCRRVKAIEAGEVTTGSMAFSWTAGADEQQWVVDYHLVSDLDTLDTAVVTTVPAVVVAGLMPSTLYSIQGTVRALCGPGDTAEAVPFRSTALTRCLPIGRLPYDVSFEADELDNDPYPIPLCWSRINLSTNGNYSMYPYAEPVTQHPGHTGHRCLVFNVTRDMGCNVYAVLPAMDAAYPVNSLELSFYAMVQWPISQYQGMCSVDVGVMSDPEDTATFVMVDSVALMNTDYRKLTFSFARYTGPQGRIALRFPYPLTSKTNTLFIDDVRIQQLSSCADIADGIRIISLLDTAVTVSVADSTLSAGWTLAYGPRGTHVGDMATVDVTGASYTLTGLVPGRQYDLYARRRCSSTEHGNWSDVLRLTAPAVPAEMPYVCGFENFEENRNWTISPTGTPNNFIIGVDTNAVHSGIQALYMAGDNGAAYSYSETYSTLAYAYRSVRLSDMVYRVNFSWKCTGGERNYDFGKAILVPVTEFFESGPGYSDIFEVPFPRYVKAFDPPSFDYFNYTGGDSRGWNLYADTLDMRGRAGDYNLVFVWNNDMSGSMNYPFSVDDISITPITCPEPLSAVVSDVTPFDATVNYARTGGSRWEVIVDSTGFTLDALPESPLLRAVDTVGRTELHNLVSNWQYYYAFRTICGEGDTSEWKPVASFRTSCLPSMLPYADGFEGDNTMFDCWRSIGGSTGAAAPLELSTSYMHNGRRSLRVNAATAIMPEFVADSLHHYAISGFARAAADSAVINVGVMTDPGDFSTFEPVASVLLPRANTWTDFSVYLTPLAEPGMEEFLNAHFIVLAVGNNTVCFDDLTVDVAPACRRPSDGIISNVTAHSFDISFIDNSGATSWVVHAGDREQVVTTNPATIAGLDPTSRYDVEVAAICGPGDTSAFINFGYLNTGCAGAYLPWSCDFESGEGYVSTTSYVAGVLEGQCWNTLGVRYGGSTNPTYYVSGTANYYNSGKQGLYMMSSSSQNSPMVLILPEMADSLNNVDVAFSYRLNNGSAWVPVPELGYITDVTDINSFVPMASGPRSTSWTDFRYSTANHPGMPPYARLAIRQAAPVKPANVAVNGYIYLDNIRITRPSACSMPERPVAMDVTSFSARVEFADTCTAHTAWEYVCGVAGFDPQSMQPVAVDSSRSFNLTGLRADVDYEVLVRALCGGGTRSEWAKTRFRTRCAPFVVTTTQSFYESFENLANNEPLGGCYISHGDSATYINKGYVNKYYPTANPPYMYRYVRTGDVCSYMYMNKNFNPHGMTFYRELHLEAGHTYEMKVYVRTNSYPAKASLLVGTVANLDSMTTLAGGEYKNCTSTIVYEDLKVYSYDHCWNELSNYYVPTVTGDYYVAVHGEVGTGKTTAYLYFDDLSVVEPVGCAPSALTVDSITASSVRVAIASFVPGDTFEYNIIRKIERDTVAAGLLATTDTFLVTGLTHSTEYTIALSRVCSSEERSEWTRADFSSECAPYTITEAQPFDDSYDNVLHDYSYIGCYEQTGATGSCRIKGVVNAAQANYAHTGPGCLNFFQTNTGVPMTHVRAFNLQAGVTYDTRVFARATNYSSNVSLVYGRSRYSLTPIVSASLNTCSAVNLGGYQMNYAPCWRELEGSFTVPADGVYYVGFRAECEAGNSYSYTYFDDFRVSVRPSCPAPRQAPQVESTTMTTATITVDLGSNPEAEVGWAVRSSRVTPADIIGTQLTTTGQAVATGLAGATSYAVYYRYICQPGDTSAWSTAARADTKATNCYEPERLRTIGIVNDHHATLTWGAAPDAALFEYQLMIDTAVIRTGTTTADTVSLDSLAATTTYLFRCRAHCQTGDTTAWQYTAFATTREPQSVPFVCGFEQTQQNAAWELLNLTGGTNRLVIGTDQSAIHTGQSSLYLSYNGVTYLYTDGATSALAQVLLEMEAGYYAVSYDWKFAGETNSIDFSGIDFARMFFVPYSTVVGLMGSQAASGAGLPPTAIQADGGRGMNNRTEWEHYTRMVRIPSSGIYRFVVAVVTDNSVTSQPSFAIDNISIVPETCDPVAGASIVETRDTLASFSVVKSAAHMPIEYGVAATADVTDVAQWTELRDSAFVDTMTVAGLDPHTDYWFYVRQICDTDRRSTATVLPFRTRATPRTVPFVCNFEQYEDNDSWTLTGGSQNRFVINTATASSGSSSLYVSNDGFANNYLINTVTRTYAYIPVRLTAGQYNLSFDWHAAGEAADYMRAFLLPASIEIGNNAFPVELTGTTLPMGALPMDGGSRLNLSSAWTARSVDFTIASSQIYNLVFAWVNDEIAGVQPPAAVDNISLTAYSCPRPENVVATATETSITLTMNLVGDNQSVGYQLYTDAAYANTVASGTSATASVTIADLEPNTRYYARLWAVCDSGETSQIVSLQQNTLCGSVSSYPYDEGFEAFTAGIAYLNELTDNCWIAVDHNYYISPGQSVGCTGARALYVNNTTTSTTLTRTQRFGLPMMDSLADKHLSLRCRVNSDIMRPQATSRLRVGYLTSANDLETFVEIGVAPVLRDDWTTFRTSLATVPAGARLALSSEGNSSLYVDDIHINRLVTPADIYDTICSGAAYSGHGLVFPMGVLADGDTLFSAVVESHTASVPDSALTVHIHVNANAVVETYDTICAGEAYTRDGWNIPRPSSRVYPRQETTRWGCDSTLYLYLTVLPSSETLYDTICQGDVYTLGTQSLTAAGVYTEVLSTGHGCMDTVTLNLAVIDTALTYNQTICHGDTYTFEGNTYSDAGVYRVVTVGAHGCTVTKTLTLSVAATDSVVDLTICQGGQALVADTVITTAGNYTLVRVNAAGCDVAYHISCTVTPPVEEHLADYACEGRPYTGFGIFQQVLTADTVVVTAGRTAEGCDSLTYAAITLRYTGHSDTTVRINRGESYEWHDNTYTQAGDYTTTVTDAWGCDSVLTLHLEVGDGVDYADVEGRIRLVPNPAEPGRGVLVFVSGIGRVERVEIINSFGAVMETYLPQTTPIDIAAPQVPGVYHVRVTAADGRVFVDKLVVR